MKKALAELSQQIQDDLITLLDGQDQTLVDNTCQVIVDRLGEFRSQHYPDHALEQTDAHWSTCLKFTINNKTPEQMISILGKPNIKDDPSKVVHSWQVEQPSTDRKLAVWDYYDSHLEGSWSGWGDIDLAQDLFGVENVD